MKNKYLFNSAEQKCKTYDGTEYKLVGKHKLVKLPMSLKYPFKSFYVNLTDGEIIDCSGYIEERCLHQISE